jgi:hypothetical protein
VTPSGIEPVTFRFVMGNKQLFDLADDIHLPQDSNNKRPAVTK